MVLCGKYMEYKRHKITGLLMCYTGDGKGKTTAALGSLIRAHGRGLKVLMLQFIKKEGSEFGEHVAAKDLGFNIISLGAGFTWKKENHEEDRQMAMKAWAVCKEKILSGDYDMIALDEITYPISYGWLDIDEVLDVINRRPKWLHIIITGRNADGKLIDASGLVTRMVEVKHHFENGIKQQPGIEY